MINKKITRNAFTWVMIFVITMFYMASSIYASEAYNQSTINSDVKEETVEWPVAPDIKAKSAILIDADTGAVIYEKNPDEKMYPASITKVLTALLSIENCSLDDTVTFSTESINSLPYDAAKVGIVPGEEVKLLDCLYVLILRSGNEVANALAEHVAGSVEKFADMMNEYAENLGLTNTHFANPSGLHDDNHYITARDYGTIIMEAVKNDVLCKIWGTSTYDMPSTNKNNSAYTIWHRHSMLVDVRNDYYDKAIGGKTGYTDEAGKTLVTYAKDGNMSLICIVLKSDNDNVYPDTRKLFEYGFNNFEKVTIDDNSMADITKGMDFFSKYNYIFNNESGSVSFSKSDIIIPKTYHINNLEKKIQYTDSLAGNGEIAKLEFYHNDQFLGETRISINNNTETNQVGPSVAETEEKEEITGPTIINIKYIYIALVMLAVLIIIIIILRLTRNKRRLRRDWTKRYKRR